MSNLKISKGFRKYLRRRKAEIRRKVLDTTEQIKLIKEIYQNILSKNQITNTDKLSSKKT